MTLVDVRTALIAFVAAAPLAVATPVLASHPREAPRAAAVVHRAEPILISTVGLERGADPAAPYLQGQGSSGDAVWRLRRPDGTALRVPSGWTDFAPLGRGAIGTYGSEAGVVRERVAADGSVTSSRAGGRYYGLVSTPDHSILGYLDNQRRFVALEDGGRRTLRFGSVSGVDEPGAIRGSGTCQEDAGDGCTVFLNKYPHRRARFTTSHGITDTVPLLKRVTDVDARGRLIGVTASDTGCSGLLVRAARVRWSTCEHELLAFAPGGRRVLAADEEYDIDDVAVYTVGGELQVSWTFPSRFRPGHERRLVDAAWEDATHVLVTAFDRGHWTVLRLGLDGSVERASARLAGSPDEPRFRLYET